MGILCECALNRKLALLLIHSSFISYTMAVIGVNFMLPLFVMFYCYYNVSVTVNRCKTSSRLDDVNIEWSEQMDVTKVKPEIQSLVTTLYLQTLFRRTDC